MLFPKGKAITIKRYHIEQKVDRDKVLLVCDVLILSQIVYKIQFGSVSHVSAQFEKIAGISSSHYKSLKKKGKPMQFDLDEWMKYYNQDRAHSGRYCYGKTPMETFKDSLILARQKMIGQSPQRRDKYILTLKN